MGLKRAAGQIATGNILFALLTFATSPIAAHELGPAGRGRLAAVLVPFAWSNVLFQFGLPIYARRAIARSHTAERGRVIGTLVPAGAIIGVGAIVAAVPAAHLLEPHDHLARSYIELGFLLLPLTLAAEVCIGLSNGEEKWRWLRAIQTAPQIVIFLTYISLLVFHTFDLQAAILAAYGGAIVTNLLAIRSVGHVTSPRFDRRVLRQAASFSPRAWLGQFANYANVRLDQLLMVPLVSPAQLGLYAVAATITALSGVVLGAVSTVIGPSVARGQHDLVGRAVRITIAVDLCFCLALAISLPLLLPLVFGARFGAALPMCYILLAGAVPGAAAWTFGQALQSAGYPNVPAIGEALALLITIPGLLLLLPPLAAVGAAIVSSVAYSFNFAIQTVLARKYLDCSFGDLTIPRRSDFRGIIPPARFGGPRRRRD